MIILDVVVYGFALIGLATVLIFAFVGVIGTLALLDKKVDCKPIKFDGQYPNKKGDKVG